MMSQPERRSVVVQFESMPKAFANFSPGFEHRREPWDIISNYDQTLKGLGGWRTLSGLTPLFISAPRVLAALEPWDIISNYDQTLKGLGGWRTLSGLTPLFISAPRVLAALEPLDIISNYD